MSSPLLVTCTPFLRGSTLVSRTVKTSICLEGFLGHFLDSSNITSLWSGTRLINRVVRNNVKWCKQVIKRGRSKWISRLINTGRPKFREEWEIALKGREEGEIGWKSREEGDLPSSPSPLIFLLNLQPSYSHQAVSPVTWKPLTIEKHF